jgi:hypothetical protein
MSRWVTERTLRASIRRGFAAALPGFPPAPPAAPAITDPVLAAALSGPAVHPLDDPASDARRLLHASGLAPERWR